MQMRVLIAEMIGSFIILLFFFGAAVLAGPATASPILPATVIGLATTAVTFALGQVSGGYFNPAITIGLVAGGRFDLAQAPGFIIAQLAGACLAAGCICILAINTANTGGEFKTIANQFSGRGDFAVPAAIAIEAVLSAILVIVFMGATSHTSLTPLAPIAIGIAVGAGYLLAMPLTKAGLNPARSTAAALFAGAEYLAMLWIFWLAPLGGALLGGWLARYLLQEERTR